MQKESVSEPIVLPGRVRRSFAKEFKADAVALVHDEDLPIVSVAHSLACSPCGLPNPSPPWPTKPARTGTRPGDEPTPGPAAPSPAPMLEYGAASGP